MLLRTTKVSVQTDLATKIRKHTYTIDVTTLHSYWTCNQPPSCQSRFSWGDTPVESAWECIWLYYWIQSQLLWKQRKQDDACVATSNLIGGQCKAVSSSRSFAFVQVYIWGKKWLIIIHHYQWSLILLSNHVHGHYSTSYFVHRHLQQSITIQVTSFV